MPYPNESNASPSLPPGWRGNPAYSSYAQNTDQATFARADLAPSTKPGYVPPHGVAQSASHVPSSSHILGGFQNPTRQTDYLGGQTARGDRSWRPLISARAPNMMATNTRSAQSHAMTGLHAYNCQCADCWTSNQQSERRPSPPQSFVKHSLGRRRMSSGRYPGTNMTNLSPDKRYDDSDAHGMREDTFQIEPDETGETLSERERRTGDYISTPTPTRRGKEQQRKSKRSEPMNSNSENVGAYLTHRPHERKSEGRKSFPRGGEYRHSTGKATGSIYEDRNTPSSDNRISHLRAFDPDREERISNMKLERHNQRIDALYNRFESVSCLEVYLDQDTMIQNEHKRDMLKKEWCIGSDSSEGQASTHQIKSLTETFRRSRKGHWKLVSSDPQCRSCFTEQYADVIGTLDEPDPGEDDFEGLQGIV